jgi:hypothetical protein
MPQLAATYVGAAPGSLARLASHKNIYVRGVVLGAVASTALAIVAAMLSPQGGSDRRPAEQSPAQAPATTVTVPTPTPTPLPAAPTASAVQDLDSQPTPAEPPKPRGPIRTTAPNFKQIPP